MKSFLILHGIKFIATFDLLLFIVGGRGARKVSLFGKPASKEDGRLGS